MELSWEVGQGLQYMVDSGLQQKIRYLFLFISSFKSYRILLSPSRWLWITYFPEIMEYISIILSHSIDDGQFEYPKQGIEYGCLSHGSLLSPPTPFILIVANVH